MENKILSCAILLNGDSPRDIRLQYGMIERMIGRFESDGTLDNDEFSLIVEEVANNQPVSVKHGRKIILQS